MVAETKYEGVYETQGNFNARVFVMGRAVHIGSYATPEEASQAYIEYKEAAEKKVSYKGVYQASGKFNARIFVDKKQVHIGRYETPEEAAKAYDAASYVLHRVDANFPESLVPLGVQQRMLKVLVGKGALGVVDLETAMEDLVVEQSLILRQILALALRDAEGEMVVEGTTSGRATSKEHPQYGGVHGD